jgi:hypothetical protein
VRISGRMWDFLYSPWCMFDLLVVAISLTSLVFSDMPGTHCLQKVPFLVSFVLIF